MEQTVTVFSGFSAQDLLFLGEAALRTLWISLLSIAIGSLLGGIFGWVLYETKYLGGILVNPVLDMFRSVPLIVQLVLFYNFAPIVGLN